MTKFILIIVFAALYGLCVQAVVETGVTVVKSTVVRK